MSLAVVLSVGTLGAMSAFGGVGYANFGFHLNPLHSSYHSPFKDQYGKGPKGNPGHILQDLLYWLLHQHH